MKRPSAVLALTVLAAATVAVAQQQTTPQPQALPSTSNTRSQTPSVREVYKQALLKNCLTHVPAANPRISEDDVRDFCTKGIRYSKRDWLR
jgi:hypothetical protein